jgi:hypothetical protein
MRLGRKDEQIACLFFLPGLSSELPKSEGGDAPERFASEELLPILKRKWRRTKKRPTKNKEQ